MPKAHKLKNYIFDNSKMDEESWDFIDKVVYINLDHRTDRNEHMKQFTSRFGDKVIRFPAIRHETGYIGCSMSHISVLKMAIQHNWDNVLILEDDAEWNKFKSGYSILRSLALKDYDVIMLGGIFISADAQTYKLYKSNATSAYIVNKHYMKRLLHNFEEGLSHLTTNNYATYALDHHWKGLQSSDNWFIVQPSLVYQRPDYSDIERRDVDHRFHMNLGIQTDVKSIKWSPILKKMTYR